MLLELEAEVDVEAVLDDGVGCSVAALERGEDVADEQLEELACDAAPRVCSSDKRAGLVSGEEVNPEEDWEEVDVGEG